MTRGMIGLCESCAHWKRRRVALNESAACSGTCDNDAFVYDQATPENGLMYWDYESYKAGFATGPKFGCIHWVLRDATKQA